MAESPEERPRRILIADDDEGSLDVLSGWLQKEGYQVVRVTNGEEALHRAQVDSPDLIFVDIMMPKLDGYSLLLRLKGNERTHRIPVLLTSWQPEPEDRDLSLTFGATGLIEKPYRIVEVAIRVADILT
jgi:CheY-like chemotaxis protein